MNTANPIEVARAIVAGKAWLEFAPTGAWILRRTGSGQGWLALPRHTPIWLIEVFGMDPRKQVVR